MSQPNSVLSTVLSLFPLFTPLLMLVRQALPSGVPAWQPWVGLAGVLVTAPAIVWVAARLFRIGIMFQGKLPKGAEILRWAIRG
jgi:ABC-2 type transport system permease protein